MRFKDLEIFISVAKHKSFSKAAEEMNCVQPNVTARIKSLEESHDCVLVHRGAGKVELTSSGELFLKYAEQLVNLQREASIAMAEMHEPAGRLVVGSMESTAAVRLPQVLSEYHARFPAVELVLKTGPSDKTMERLAEFEVDMALVSGVVDGKRWTVDSAYQEELAIVAPRSVSDIDQLDEITVLVFKNGCSYRAQLENWLRQTGRNPYRVLEFGSLEGILGCVGAGMGITFLPVSLIEQAGHQERFSVIRLPAEFANMTTWLVRRKEERYSKALTELRELIIGQPSVPV
ncbi:LysR family transcriptional regulator [Ferrimonas sp. YFM]|uniref:LysR family transcriptional regulator n=1 Tax=Ferrimonas sp. YFM TaxID=3028878 RepID=UPI0025728200|nr:LysR family transcriptional regulator [Ferrimonas sp. YFM]BDY05405.1 LysR family transcriptional regulator [Ferrimonas sp. YFM]